MHLDQVDKDQSAILVAILALLKQLPDDLKSYTPALGELSTYFKGGGHKRGDHNPSPGSLTRVRTVKAKR